MRILTLDFETRSAASLDSYRRYATDPSTGVLCIGLQWADLSDGRTWVPAHGPVATPADRCPEEVLIAIREGFLVYAHNVTFDRAMWLHYCVPKLGWPEIPFEQWRCTMSICAYYAIPMGLGRAAMALGLSEQKQTEADAGKLAISQCCKPRKPLMAELAEFTEQDLRPHEYPLLWWEDHRRLGSVYAYCRQDVRTQTQLLRTLGELPPDRLADWQLDQKINERGVPLDIPNLVCASSLVDKTLAWANTEINQITGGLVRAVTLRNKIIDYLRMQSVLLPSLDKEAVENALADHTIQGVPRRVLELRQLAGKSSLSKVEAMIDHVDVDARVRNGLAWHGASTGRWAGRGVQWQNFPRDCLKPSDADDLFQLMEEVGDHLDPFIQFARAKDTEVPGLLSQGLRAFVKPPEGKKLLISDFNAIECRVLTWLSGCRLLHSAFQNKECPYCQFASRATGKKVIKGMPERQLGKVCVLALGYQMGGPRLKETAAGPGYNVTLSEEEAVTMVKLFRTTYPEIPDLWKRYEAAFIRAVESQSIVPSARVSFGCRGKWAWAQLPSGRCIWFYDPRIEMGETPWGARQQKLSYMTVESQTKRWVRRATYGGLITENIDQAVSADILTGSIRRVEEAGIPVIASIHDEVIAESTEDRFDEFHRLMEVVPAWASGCYISAESHVARRYGK